MISPWFGGLSCLVLHMADLSHNQLLVKDMRTINSDKQGGYCY